MIRTRVDPSIVTRMLGRPNTRIHADMGLYTGTVQHVWKYDLERSRGFLAVYCLC